MEMLPAFLLGVTMLTLLFLMNRASFLLDLILNKNVPLWDTFLLFTTMMPFILSVTIPMTMMVATLLAFGRLSSDMEVTAFKSGGVHMFRLIAPVLVLGLSMTTVMLLFNDRILPMANFTFKKIHFKMLKDQASIAIKEKVFINTFEGQQFYIDRKDSDGQFAGVKVFDRWSPQTSIQTTLAKTGNLETNQDSFQVFFHLRDGVMTWDNKNYNTYNRLYFSHYAIRLKLENQLAQMTDIKKGFEEMNLSELSQEMAATSDPIRKNSLSNEFQKRLSLPFACLVLTWFSAPLGLWIRSKGFISFVLGLAMIFIYYLLFNLGQVLSERGSVSPILGLWWANGLLALAGGLIYYLVISENSSFRRFAPPVLTKLSSKGKG